MLLLRFMFQLLYSALCSFVYVVWLEALNSREHLRGVRNKYQIFVNSKKEKRKKKKKKKKTLAALIARTTV